MVIYLVRHGETEWNLQGKLQGREDIPLNKTGIWQAKVCGNALQNTKFHCIQTSPLQRAMETAEIIALHQNCRVIVNSDLIERDYGNLSGLFPQERQEFARQGGPDGVEPWEMLAKRAFWTINKLADACPESTIAVVSHGAWINALLAVVSGHEIGSGKTRLKNACISMLYQEKNKWEIGFYNLTGEDIKNGIPVRI